MPVPRGRPVLKASGGGLRRCCEVAHGGDVGEDRDGLVSDGRALAVVGTHSMCRRRMRRCCRRHGVPDRRGMCGRTSRCSGATSGRCSGVSDGMPRRFEIWSGDVRLSGRWCATIQRRSARCRASSSP
jgi:calcineurin-like phosphoesterase